MRRNRDRSAEIAAKRITAKAKFASPRGVTAGSAVVNAALLGPNNSYGFPDYVERGCYLDKPFTCNDCDTQEIWIATQQKWWYESAKGDMWTTATRCRACRRRERGRKAEARCAYLEGIARKKAKQQ